MFQYSKEGKVFSTSSRAAEWDHIIPDSLDEEFHRVICQGGKDEEQHQQEQAAKYYMLGRQNEKTASFHTALMYYESALAFADGNSKILAAIARVRPKTISR